MQSIIKKIPIKYLFCAGGKMGGKKMKKIGQENIVKRLEQNNNRCYLNKMSSILTNLSVIQKLSKDLVQAKPLNYSQQCIPFYVNESKFTVENIQDLRNPSGFLIRSTLIRHRANYQLSNQTLKQVTKQFKNVQLSRVNLNSKCVVFLHGLGSSRLEALPIVDSLPQDYCLFAFDFAGSGKSEGDNITYGLRQSEDITNILEYLKTNKGIREFIIWGRSMGAVAALLFGINLAQSSKDSISSKAQLARIKGLVVDSPFSDFRQITKQIALKRVNIPQFLIDIALNIIQNSFNEILKDHRRGDKIYNPFEIKLGSKNIQTNIPTVFIYSLADEVVPKEHSQRIIKSYRSLFDKIVMQQCTHNQSRPKQTLLKIFQVLNKFQSRNNNRLSNSQAGAYLSRDTSLNLRQSKGGKGRRGISVQSRQKQVDRKNQGQQLVLILGSLTEQEQQKIVHSKISQKTYSSLKIQPKRNKALNYKMSMSKNAYIYDSANVSIDKGGQNLNNISPSKIMIPNTMNRTQNKNATIIPKKPQRTMKVGLLTNNFNNYYNTIDNDISILQKKLLKQHPSESEQINQNKIIDGKNCFKNRRHSQLNRKVQYQLSHTRYL